MATSQSLTLYHPSTSTSLAASRISSQSLNRLFTAETGTHVATELLYRILIAICQRVFNSFEAFASRRLDSLLSYLEASKLEREERKANKVLSALAVQEKERGGNDGGWPTCPMGKDRERPAWIKKSMEEGRGPPEWIRKRMEEGRGPPFGPPAWVKNAVQKMRDEEAAGQEVYFGNEKAVLFE